MTRLLPAAAFLLAASAASADSVVGSWSCRSITKTEHFEAATRFTAEGVLQMTASVARFDRNGKRMSSGEFTYRATYEQRGTELHSTPVSAEIHKFMSGTVDIRKSPEAWVAHKMIMRDDPKPTTLVFSGPSHMKMIAPDGGTVTCTRN